MASKISESGVSNGKAKVGVEAEAYSGELHITSSGSINSNEHSLHSRSRSRRVAIIDHFRGRYPHSIVWTPITVISWFFPFLGHVGIAYTNGKIRDFADAYVVSDDRMTYGRPAKYMVMNTNLAQEKEDGWDTAIDLASEEYTVQDHDTLCDNSLSMVALALNLMRYKGSRSWNMFWVFLYIVLYSKYVGCGGFWRTWGPFLLLVVVASILALPFSFGNGAHTLGARGLNLTNLTQRVAIVSRGGIDLQIP